MRPTLKQALSGAALSIALLSGGAAADEPKKLVTVVTSAEPLTQLMSMVLTMQSIQQGAAARILLCGPAGDLALLDAPAGAVAPQAPKGMSPQGLMKKIMDAGAPVEVCALYLPNKGVGLDALIPGVGAAKPPVMAGHLLEDGATVLSF